MTSRQFHLRSGFSGASENSQAIFNPSMLSLQWGEIGTSDSQASLSERHFWYRWYREFRYNPVGESDINLQGNEP